MAITTARQRGVESSIIHRAMELQKQFDQHCRPAASTSVASSSSSSSSSSSYSSSSLAGNDHRDSSRKATSSRGLSEKKKRQSRGEIEIPSADAAVPAASVTTAMLDQVSVLSPAPAPLELQQQQPLRAKTKYSLQTDILPVIEKVYKCTTPMGIDAADDDDDSSKSIADKSRGGNELMDNFHIVPFDYVPPVAFEGSSCVYILQVFNPHHKENFPDFLYVGETESVLQRFEQHRRRYAMTSAAVVPVVDLDSNSKSSSSSSSSPAAAAATTGYRFNAAIIRVDSKSHARRLETNLILELK
eukprot:CAMPEP_0174973808 /NCGR_PEP_ID=MMETSP0004_2-20121128/11451_1 /TAXON_ID=420556 /ORGANISM="Ochromonas sp., Strain CCMP1393" /LENGTH=300 /DNA_ID=CAMNT_0016224305 /DNA_START=156 /DNA_END=1055 /DNA_ORIENTATION=-